MKNKNAMAELIKQTRKIEENNFFKYGTYYKYFYVAKFQ